MLIDPGQKEGGTYEYSMISGNDVGENLLVCMSDMRIAVRVIYGGRDEVFHKLLANNLAAPG